MKITLLFIFSVICGGSLYFALLDPTIPITITEKKAQETIDLKMPFEKAIDIKIPVLKDRVVNIKVYSAVVDFSPPKSIRVKSYLYGEESGRNVKGEIDAEGSLIYKNGSFYLSDIVIHGYKIDDFKIKEKDKKMIKSGKNLLSGVNKFLKKHDVDGLAGNGISDSYINDKKKEIKGRIRLFVIDKLETTPIYSINSDDYKQNLAKLALRDINATDDAIVVTMSLGKLIKTLWLYVIASISGVFMFIVLIVAFMRGTAHVN